MTNARSLAEELRYWSGEYDIPTALVQKAADWIDRASAMLPLMQRNIGSDVALEIRRLLAVQMPQPRDPVSETSGDDTPDCDPVFEGLLASFGVENSRLGAGVSTREEVRARRDAVCAHFYRRLADARSQGKS